ncbi:MAG: DUF192 domain-containing protein [Paracoccus sp. (in: a-proteobacteria)]|uniref:DUF192 domain-containing protein n=1 Tax=Paracoccus sp. TaxID=267 RepID=UPI0026DFE75D|nr:DUF192 domain-containing protein [Paracoccus sp. (in: a-proteobacteria)]MDO5613961.1 DUF192 domain-containing protein [Paracoccus sp. (in: a-proteobacteria)]
MSVRALGFLVLLAAPVAALADGASCSADQAILRSNGTDLPITVEVVDTPDTRARGLMFRRNLPQMQGMLFVYEQPQPVSFWMRNTLIPLDMLFMDDSGTVRHIHAQAQPLDETPIPGAARGDTNPNRLLVLEIAGGEAARLGLKPGDVMAHPSVPQTRAALPCR